MTRTKRRSSPLTVLLVEPDYRRLSADTMRRKSREARGRRGDDSLWYPPLGLMKLSRFHKDRGDSVHFAYGCDESAMTNKWDRVYITTLFTFGWDRTVKTVNFYKAIGRKIYVGGVMASIMPRELCEATGISPVCGIIDSPRRIDLPGGTNIDLLTPDYDLIDRDIYAVNETFYAYASRGCVNRCGWCAVPSIEPDFVPYIDIRPTIVRLRDAYGDKSRLKLMDNNVLASPRLAEIVRDLCDLGYYRGAFTETGPKKQRVVDFNQGLDASFVNDETMKLMSQLNVKPFRIAFDRLKEKRQYLHAIETARRYGFTLFSNYMLYNWHDTPRDLYERIMVNIKLNAKWRHGSNEKPKATVFSYPMRYAPVKSEPDAPQANRSRDYLAPNDPRTIHVHNGPVWTRRFVRNVEIMKGTVHGAISTTPGLARRTIGESFEEFVANLFMPEVLLRNRNKHEKRVYEHEPKRRPGTGKVEEFRQFILRLLKRRDDRFWKFHDAVSQNTRPAIREYLKRCEDREMRKWLALYLKR